MYIINNIIRLNADFYILIKYIPVAVSHYFLELTNFFLIHIIGTRVITSLNVTFNNVQVKLYVCLIMFVF